MSILKSSMGTMVIRAIGRAVERAPQEPVSRRVSFIGSKMEIAKPAAPFSKETVAKVASNPNARFPTLRDID